MKRRKHVKDALYMFLMNTDIAHAVILRTIGRLRKKVTKLNRLETEIENHRIRAIMSGNIGNTNEAKDEWYLYDCLSALKNIQDSGDCNVCASKKDCQYAPTVGQMVRYNCPFYKKEENKNET